MTIMKTSPIEAFINFAGSQSQAARLIGISYSHMSLIANGKRGVSPTVALRIEHVSEGRFRKESFIWPDEEAA